MIILWFIGIIILIIVITVLLNIFKNWSTMMNYKNLFSFFIIGAIPTSIISYMNFDNPIIGVSLFTILIISSLFYGAFKKDKK